MLTLSVQRRQGDFRLDLDLSAGPGVTALFGPSGSGKTSAINVVAGLARPDSGRVVVDGRVLFDAAAGIDVPPEKRRLGYVFQEHRLFPHLSVRQNLLFGWKRIPVSERSVELDAVIEVLGIASLLDRRPAGLSGGEKQRVAIGRALLASPRILLMDEPLASLDANRKAEVLPFIADMARRFAVPILYVSHAMDEVLHLADTLVLMEDGHAAACGPTEDILSRADLRHLTGHGEAGAVIRATVSGHRDEHGVTALAFTGGTVLVGRVDLPVGASVRLRIHARDIALALDVPGHVSIRNILAGRVVSVTPSVDHLVDVMLDCGGQTIWSRITSLAQSNLCLRPGMRAFALLKAVTVARSDIADRSPIEG
ncbi:molybdate transporter subunit; ATP-binding component of ABC superfamily [Candidatus Terasakiella magnetica]|nr:molybdate transporter subunit; ATP-binding component of ABC superfamily [Candidatus Terasakiella magnetica]